MQKFFALAFILGLFASFGAPVAIAKEAAPEATEQPENPGEEAHEADH